MGQIIGLYTLSIKYVSTMILGVEDMKQICFKKILHQNYWEL